MAICRLVLVFVAVLATGGLEARANSLNFLIFIADDVSAADCGACGHPHIRTPNIDQLASDGLLFENAYLTCSSCSPSRASILTSRYPHNTGAGELHLPLPAEQIVLAEPLNEHGYYTASVGKWHLGKATMRDFDHVRKNVGRMVETLRERPREKPFFLWFAFHDAHRPYNKGAIENPHSAADAVVPPFLPDTDVVREDLANYYDEITRLDAAIGDCLVELRRQGIAGETVVIYMADNGRPFPRCKTTLYDSGIQTPLIIRWPGHVPAGISTQALVSSIDVAATICELADVAIPDSFQGTSFAHVLENPRAEHREMIFAEHNWHDYTARQRAVRTDRFKYIRDFYNDLPETPPADAVRSPTYRQMQRMRKEGTLTAEQAEIFQAPRPSEVLFDVTQDPHELRNLADDPQFADVLQKMRDRLAKWQERTGDDPPEHRRPDGFDRETGRRLK